jgi:hypothetical protein
MSLYPVMVAHAASDVFARRYYRWALDDAGREVREGFPLVRAVASGLTIRAVAYLESLPAERRQVVTTTLVKRAHRRALELTGEAWGPREEQIERGYIEAVRIPRPEEAAHSKAVLADRAPRIDRARFLRAVRSELAPILGPGEAFSTAHEWRFDTAIGPWALVTLVDVGGQHHQLAYTQTLRADVARPLKEGVSLTQWLGLGGQTIWNRLVEADTPEAARSLVKICAHFLQAVPALVADLAPSARP